MRFLHYYNQQMSMVLRTLITIVFVFWLIWVVVQYYWIDTPNKSPVADEPIPIDVSFANISLPPLPPLPMLAARSQMTKKERQTKDVNQLAKTTLSSKQRVEQIYQQLSAEGINVQLAWPRHTGERKAVFDFLYQCVGVQFAVLNGNAITRLSQLKSNEYSDWIRIAQGNLSSKEQNWLNAFTLNGTPIRLFPREVDFRLASHLANALKGDNFVSLRAIYHLTGQKLLLTDIHLNNQRILDSWMLFRGKC